MMRPKDEVTKRPDGAPVDRWARPTGITDRHRAIARRGILASEVEADNRIALRGEVEDFPD